MRRPQRPHVACFNGLPPLPNDLVSRASRGAAAAALCAALGAGCIVRLPATARASVLAPVITDSLPAPQLDAEHALAQEAWTLVSRYYRDGTFGGASWGQQGGELQRAVLQTRPSTYRAIRRALTALGDPYTRLLTPGEMEGLRKFDVSGVGLLLTSGADGDVVVAADPLPGTAAAAARIARGDVLLGVDGADVRERGAFEVARLMQGEEGGELALRFGDAGDVALRRQFGGDGGARASSVTHFLSREGGRAVGHVQLGEFAASSRARVARAVRELRAAGADAFVLDVRGNPGGVFEGALEIAGIFEGADVPVARVSGRGEAETFSSALVGADDVERAPLAVVVDARSASASEVLAGGLRDVCRAAVVGDSNSYGKGLIQGVFGLSDGSGLVLTVAEYETPKGVGIQGKGLVPNFALNESILDRALHGIGIYGPAKVDWERVASATAECREAL